MCAVADDAVVNGEQQQCCSDTTFRRLWRTCWLPAVSLNGTDSCVACFKRKSARCDDEQQVACSTNSTAAMRKVRRRMYWPDSWSMIYDHLYNLQAYPEAAPSARWSSCWQPAPVELAHLLALAAGPGSHSTSSILKHLQRLWLGRSPVC
jgi:hypothetical protein